jgi:hypothetical protein
MLRSADLFEMSVDDLLGQKGKKIILLGLSLFSYKQKTRLLASFIGLVGPWESNPFLLFIYYIKLESFLQAYKL